MKYNHHGIEQKLESDADQRSLLTLTRIHVKVPAHHMDYVQNEVYSEPNRTSQA